MLLRLSVLGHMLWLALLNLTAMTKLQSTTSLLYVFNHLQVNFLSPAKLGETVMLEGHLLKMGRSLAFTQVNLLHEDGSMIATGRHTKAFPFVKAE